METKEITTEPQIIEPKEAQDFSKPFTVRWDPMERKNVKTWWLCAGTVEADVKEGDWNLFSESSDENREKTIDVSHLKDLKAIRIQLLCTLDDPNEGTMVLEPIVIKRI